MAILRKKGITDILRGKSTSESDVSDKEISSPHSEGSHHNAENDYQAETEMAGTRKTEESGADIENQIEKITETDQPVETSNTQHQSDSNETTSTNGENELQSGSKRDSNQTERESGASLQETITLDELPYSQLCYPFRFGLFISYFKALTDWNEQNVFGKIITVSESPVTLIRILTIPSVDEGIYCREICAISISLAPIMIMFAFNGDFLFSFNIIQHTIFYTFCFVLGIVCYIWFCPSFQTPQSWKKGFILFVAFLTCASWILTLANELVGLLEVFSFMVGISEHFAGITFLAWGNSVGDLCADRSIAIAGNPQGAVTACYAGPIFNILWSFGCTIFVASAFGQTPPNAKWGGVHYLVQYCILITAFLATFGTTVVNKFHMGKGLGFALIGIYATFFLVSMYPEFSSYLPVPGVLKAPQQDT